ncbi:MAG TPA: hypothetical protein DCQ50_18525 [Chryseobacterium sp.]|nr:hypothetical protein [Chryseobacterium sp.]
MTIEIESNKLCRDRQTINFNNSVLTLVGENGCGKSSILEAIFEKYIEDEEIRTICFTSGQNELFSRIFNKHKSKSKKYLKKEENLYITSFYFDYNWVRILIFFASILKSDGKVREFLVSKNYVDIHDEQDISSRLSFPFRIRKYYKNKIDFEIEQESKPDFDFNNKLLRKTYFHEIILKFIEVNGYHFDFGDPRYQTFVKKWLTLTYNNVFRIFTDKDINRIFSFWALATHTYEKNVDIEDCTLHFKNKLGFRQLSDGEYQLLSIYALIDLFDNENTVFLFDEIDSHLYYKNIEKLWSVLKNQIKGKVITTTHIADSLVQNCYESLTLVEKGKIIVENTAIDLLNRLNSLSNSTEYYFKIASKMPYIALVEDESDWIIFKELSKLKLGEDYQSSKIDKVTAIKCPSGFSNLAQKFGESRLKWMENFSKANNSFGTKAVFMICDRDELPISNISQSNGVSVTGVGKILKFDNNQKFAYLLSWKRKQIENYLLSHTMLNFYGKLADVDSELGASYQLMANEQMDIKPIQDLEIKSKVQALYIYNSQQSTASNPEGIDYNQLYLVLSHIPATEISADIVNMYNFIVSKIN